MDQAVSATKEGSTHWYQRVRRGAIGRVLLALFPGTLFLVFFVWRASENPFGHRRFTLFDDAMISMTYARTLAETGEFVWFPGAPRIQGFTNLLWTLYMAGLHSIGLEESSAALAISSTGILIILGTGALIYSIVTKGLGHTPASQIIGAVVAGAVPFLFPLMFWTLRGLEVGLLALLLVICIWGSPVASAVSEDKYRLVIAGLSGALGVVTRIDFVVLIGAISVVSAFWIPGARARIQAFALLIGPALLALVCVFIFQEAYYGDWLTNTYRLKMDGVVPQVRVLRGLLTSGKTVTLALVLVITHLFLRTQGTRIQRRLSAISLAAFFSALLYSVWVGGDAWEQGLLVNRFVSVSLPAAMIPVALATGVVISGSMKRVFRPIPVVAALVVGALAAGWVTNPYRFTWGHVVVTIMVTSICLGFCVIAFAVNSRFENRSIGTVVAALSSMTLVLTAVSAYPAYLWARDGGQHVRDDQKMTESGYALAQATSEDAVIATVWAGAPAYYSSRSMIDLLGKSDRRIASLKPSGAFYPGHNKWDLEYSIGELQPDVVFQMWGSSGGNSLLLLLWGYRPGCMSSGDKTPLYFLRGSNNVNWQSVVGCGEFD